MQTAKFSNFLKRKNIIVGIAVVLVVGIIGVGRELYSSAATPFSLGVIVNHMNCTSRPVLRNGSSGTCVKASQAAMQVIDGAPGGQPRADGAFGNTTKSYVQRFQSSKGLVSDGVVGGKTWAAIDSTRMPDVNGDGKVDLRDLSLILSKVYQ